MKVILDTNFILYCMKQKIDFISLANELFSENIDFLIAEEVINELKNISERKGEKTKDKDAAKLGLKFVAGYEKVQLNNKNTDLGIINFAEKNNAIIATSDRGLKSKTKARILSIKDKKSLEII